MQLLANRFYRLKNTSIHVQNCTCTPFIPCIILLLYIWTGIKRKALFTMLNYKQWCLVVHQHDSTLQSKLCNGIEIIPIVQSFFWSVPVPKKKFDVKVAQFRSPLHQHSVKNIHHQVIHQHSVYEIMNFKVKGLRGDYQNSALQTMQVWCSLL